MWRFCAILLTTTETARLTSWQPDACFQHSFRSAQGEFCQGSFDSSCGLQTSSGRREGRLLLREPQGQYRWIKAARTTDHQRWNLSLLRHSINREWRLAQKLRHVANREQAVSRFQSKQNVEHLRRVRLLITREAGGVAWNLCCWGKSRGLARPDCVPHGCISI